MHIYVYQTIIVAENENKKHSEELRKQCLETEFELNNATNELNCPRRMQNIQKNEGVLLYGKVQEDFPICHKRTEG